MKKIIFLLVVVLFAFSMSDAEAKNFDIKLNGVYSNQKSTNLLNFVGKRPILAVFFYPLCPPCKKSSKVINKIYEKYKDLIFVVGVSLSKDRYDIEDFIDDLHIKYPIYRIANKNQLRNIGGILATPTSILINKEGSIVLKIPGAVNFNFLLSKINKCIK